MNVFLLLPLLFFINSTTLCLLIWEFSSLKFKEITQINASVDIWFIIFWLTCSSSLYFSSCLALPLGIMAIFSGMLRFLYQFCICYKFLLCSVQFSCSVVSNSLRPHGLQHLRLPWPSPIPGAFSNSCPLSRWCNPTISSSVVPFSSCLQSFPASGSFTVNQYFISGGQSIGASASSSP